MRIRRLRDVDFGSFPATREHRCSSAGRAGQSLEAVVGFAQAIKGFRAGVAGKYAEEYTASTRISSAVSSTSASRR